MEKINDFLENHVDQELDVETKKKLINMCDIRDDYGRLQKSISKINDFLSDNFAYSVISIRYQVNAERKTKWKIICKKVA